MDKIAGRLTVFFEEPFWIGVFERISEGKLSVCKITFGAEPKDYEIYDFVLKNYYRLKFSLAVATDGSCSQYNKVLNIVKVTFRSLLSIKASIRIK